MRTAEQLKRLTDKFSAYLEDLLKSEDRDAVNNAVHKMFVHLQTYPDSLDQFLHLIEYILGSEKGFEDQLARQIAIEALKNHSNKTWHQRFLANMKLRGIIKMGKGHICKGTMPQH